MLHTNCVLSLLKATGDSPEPGAAPLQSLEENIIVVLKVLYP